MTITRKALREYLEANKTTLFQRADPFECPIAGYYREQYPRAHRVSVVGACAFIRPTAYSEERAIKNPLWAQKFVSDFDSSLGKGDIRTGEQALEVLCSR